MTGDFLSDIDLLRERAHASIEDGPITDANGTDRERVIDVLNEVLATEIVCVLRYKRHYFTAHDINAGPIATEFLEHAIEEQSHADKVAARIAQLGGQPNFNPEGLASRSQSDDCTATDLIAMVKETLIAERIAAASHQEIIGWLGEADPTTRRVMEDIFANEEKHAEDMLAIVAEVGAS